VSLQLPALYPLVDVDALGANQLSADEREQRVIDFALALVRGGATLMQLRAKHLSDAELLPLARSLRHALPSGVTLILNDRADLALSADCAGVHLGQEDLSPAAARRILGDGKIIGLSTHNREQFTAALAEPIDYVALGPIFSTTSKANAAPVVGLDGLKECSRQINSSACKDMPLVAIGGITRDNARLVRECGADSIALIAALIQKTENSVADFLSQML